MHIVYAVTTCSDRTYAALFQDCPQKPAFQSQKYHRLLIEGLSQWAEVDVAATLPLNRANCGRNLLRLPPETEGGARYHYAPASRQPLLKALLGALGMFGIHAVVPDLLKKGIQGLIGYGFWMVAFVLLWAAALLLFPRDRRQTLRLWGLALLPVVGGALLHILLWPGTYPIDFYLVGRLWTDGVQSMGGGVVSGFLAVVTVKGISRLAAGLVFALLFVILLALAAHVTRGQVSGAVSKARDHHAQRAARREKYAEYDDEDEDEDDLYGEEVEEPEDEPEHFHDQHLHLYFRE